MFVDRSLSPRRRLLWCRLAPDGRSLCFDTFSDATGNVFVVSVNVVRRRLVLGFSRCLVSIYSRLTWSGWWWYSHSVSPVGVLQVFNLFDKTLSRPQASARNRLICGTVGDLHYGVTWWTSTCDRPGRPQPA